MKNLIITLRAGEDTWYINLSKISRIKIADSGDTKYPYALTICYSANDKDSIKYKKEKDRNAALALILKYMQELDNTEVHNIDDEIQSVDYKALEKSLQDYDPMAAIR